MIFQRKSVSVFYTQFFLANDGWFKCCTTHTHKKETVQLMTDSFWKQNHYSAISSKDFHHTLKIIHCQMLMLIVNILRNTSIYVCASLCICCILSSWALHNVILDVGLNNFFVLLSLYPQVILSILFRMEYWEVFSFVLSLLNIRTMKPS